MTGVQTCALPICDLKPSDFLLVGFTQQYQDFTERLSDYLDIRICPDVHLRKGENESLDSTILENARHLLSREIELYQAFYQHWA